MQATFCSEKERYSMTASVAFRWLHAEEILLGRQQFEAGVSRVARKPAQMAPLRAAAIPIPRRRAEPGV
jgi:hypothetical protein